MAKSQSKEARIIEIMNTMADEPMAATCAKIAKELDFAVSRARAYYSTMVRSGRATGKVVASAPARAKKEPRVRVPGGKKMVEDAEAAFKGAPVPGMDLKQLAHEEVLDRLLARDKIWAGDAVKFFKLNGSRPHGADVTCSEELVGLEDALS